MKTIGGAIALTSGRWPAKKLKHLVSRVYGGGTPDKNEPLYWLGGDIPWVSPKDMKRAFLDDAEDHITDAGLKNSATALVGPGSLLVVARSGILAHSIPVAITTGPVALNQDMKALVPGRELQIEFLRYWIEGQQRELLALWRHQGATVESLDLYRMMNTWLAIPGCEEQRAIAAFLDVETGRIDRIIQCVGGVQSVKVAASGTFLHLLVEKRSALITAAVNGHIDPEAWLRRGDTNRHLDRIEADMTTKAAE